MHGGGGAWSCDVSVSGKKKKKKVFGVDTYLGTAALTYSPSLCSFNENADLVFMQDRNAFFWFLVFFLEKYIFIYKEKEKRINKKKKNIAQAASPQAKTTRSTQLIKHVSRPPFSTGLTVAL